MCLTIIMLSIRLSPKWILEKEGNLVARGTIFIDHDRCKGCELCTTVCPQEILFMNHAILNVRGYHPAELVDPDDQCTGCAICAVICPDVCITVFREPVGRQVVPTA